VPSMRMMACLHMMIGIIAGFSSPLWVSIIETSIIHDITKV